RPAGISPEKENRSSLLFQQLYHLFTLIQVHYPLSSVLFFHLILSHGTVYICIKSAYFLFLLISVFHLLNILLSSFHTPLSPIFLLPLSFLLVFLQICPFPLLLSTRALFFQKSVPFQIVPLIPINLLSTFLLQMKNQNLKPLTLIQLLLLQFLLKEKSNLSVILPAYLFSQPILHIQPVSFPVVFPFQL